MVVAQLHRLVDVSQLATILLEYAHRFQPRTTPNRLDAKPGNAHPRSAPAELPRELDGALAHRPVASW